ncbi:MAG: hypothetical protein COT91_01125 [Candidatus Doudnabacteria bacterium CG10_big_fil_rev_8_21_14_0_10_41_10]|uniref:Uncharacterized protein n=1 Tax=Candidatus Doudnabacteria bacterium CG10_big_fil_rev_8_21_14_0_10_41_10 TaxID=1974551 RepID=A0A2H0VEF5_9BACT|nr:MAG: hypothetical protein COT91_01125 [Candidatus Doudnabacteria bacterium CG10_big_fil_rev_8_21_14_0_10_41_10]
MAKIDNCCHEEGSRGSETEKTEESRSNNNFWKIIALVFIALLFATQVFGVNIKSRMVGVIESYQTTKLEQAVLPAGGVDLPVVWGDLGAQMVAVGVIDPQEFEELYQKREGLSDEMKAALYSSNNGRIKITSDNAHVLLNLLWAFGLSNKNSILEEGPMVDEKYGGDAGKFASTGGWSLGIGSAMDHYSAHEFAVLTPAQQELVERVSKNIYRPCCGNSVYFPDCNHGMAMLGLLELMAAQGVVEDEMYKAVLQVNSFWFPDTYLTIAKYQKEKHGIPWDQVSPKEVLGSVFSSAAGYQGILAEIEPPKAGGGPSCGV